MVADDTIIAKTGKMIENVSYIYDYSLGRSVSGFCIVTLGFLAGNSFYPTNYACRFGKKRNGKSPDEKIGDPRSISGLSSYEA